MSTEMIISQQHRKTYSNIHILYFISDMSFDRLLSIPVPCVMQIYNNDPVEGNDIFEIIIISLLFI